MDLRMQNSQMTHIVSFMIELNVWYKISDLLQENSSIFQAATLLFDNIMGLLVRDFSNRHVTGNVSNFLYGIGQILIFFTTLSDVKEHFQGLLKVINCVLKVRYSPANVSCFLKLLSYKNLNGNNNVCSFFMRSFVSIRCFQTTKNAAFLGNTYA